MKKFVLMAFVAFSFIVISCDDDDDDNNLDTLTLNLTGLEDLGADYVYEGWIIVNGAPVSTGTFSSTTFPQSFVIDENMLESATTFVLTIEPAVDPDPAPADTKYLVGDFNGDNANVTTAIVGDFSNSMGTYILATPTDNDNTNEASGVWWLDNSSGSPVAGLDLPTLPDGWMYEGWAVINGMPVSTGTFTAVDATDANDMFSGPVPLPMPNPNGFFPGEDFLINAPAGLTFPTDLSGGTAVISIEPYPDNSAAPFTLKPLVGVIPANANVHSPYDMMQNLGSLPSGTVTR
ncbi:anti-sigma factor [Urechidicola sp. KH5]